MSGPSERTPGEASGAEAAQANAEDDRRRLMGLGDRSFHKSYYPELRQRLADLERFHAIYQNAPVGIYRSTPAGRYLDVNPRFAALFGYASPDDVLARVTDTARQIWCDPADRAAMMRILEEKGEVSGFEARNRRADGAVIWTSRNLRVSRGPHGEAVCYDGFVTDVTDRKQVEEMMRQSEKMFSLGGLAAGMAHELNNPLGGVLQGIQNVRRRIWLDLPANLKVAGECGLDLEAMRRYLDRREVGRFIEGIRECGERAAAIVGNMLDFGRRGEGRARPTDLVEIMDKAVSLAESDYDLKKRFGIRSISIQREYEPDLPKAACVAPEIEQVFFNVIKNSAHALAGLAPGGSPQITLRLARELDKVRIEIEDNGPGMEEHVRKRIFEPFFTTKEPGLGTGLGLSVSYFIVTQDHGGSFTVESEPGKGTKSVIRLPVWRDI